MKQYQVTFAPNTALDNIQREVINARDEQDARAVYAASDCWVYEVVELPSEQEWRDEVTANMADDADLHQTQEDARY